MRASAAPDAATLPSLAKTGRCERRETALCGAGLRGRA